MIKRIERENMLNNHVMWGKFDIVRIIYHEEGLDIIIQDIDEKAVANLYFESLIAFQVHDESRALKMFELQGISDCGIFKYEKSGFLSYASSINITGKLPTGTSSYIVASRDEVVEVLSQQAPELRL